MGACSEDPLLCGASWPLRWTSLLLSEWPGPPGREAAGWAGRQELPGWPRSVLKDQTEQVRDDGAHAVRWVRAPGWTERTRGALG